MPSAGSQQPEAWILCELRGSQSLHQKHDFGRLAYRFPWMICAAKSREPDDSIVGCARRFERSPRNPRVENVNTIVAP